MVLPRQVLRELQANLSEDELKALFRLVMKYSRQVIVRWEKAKMGTISRYRNLGCRLGDAALAAHLEELGVKVLVTENRHFLEEIEDLPFRRLSASEALAELERPRR